MPGPLVISHDPNGKWYYMDDEGTSSYFNNINDLFRELKSLGKVQDSCPTCQDE